MAFKVTAELEYSGLPDYWSGNGQRWADDHACIFAIYGPETTLRELIDEWARDDSDFDAMGKETLWAEISESDIRDALIEMLTDDGRAALDDISEFAREYGDANGHDYDFDPDSLDDDGSTADRACDCCASDDSGDSPQAIVMLTLSCDVCGKDADDCECE